MVVKCPTQLQNIGNNSPHGFTGTSQNTELDEDNFGVYLHQRKI